ncbi:nicotinate-nucleotide adenylyltransferase [Deinobacterium chartae]|uniref:Probable nicotinate-nucleotide adenylyltransferase n=1 Tax=Deinobacterium chartae TaxID=521158 RepID=A0A841I392_9DEIO|nr:nicotinate-nucleotide adenylyltransferase [Deinobacterium chartae]MBB6098838.1 nicotinate-nucleotide adenylyltransferase [Deinobacterium chartae]
MNIGLLGGSFDPVHLGHLLVAIEAGYRLGLDRVWLLPARESPGKAPPAAAHHRLAMLEIAAQADPILEVCALEFELPAPSYTYRTLEALQARHPELRFSLILGMDALLGLPGWRDAQRVLELAHVVGVTRPGFAASGISERIVKPGGLYPGALRYNAYHDGLPPGPTPSSGPRELRFERGASLITVPAFEVSSREVRRRVKASEPITHLVPRGVADYLSTHQLYRS